MRLKIITHEKVVFDALLENLSKEVEGEEDD